MSPPTKHHCEARCHLLANLPTGSGSCCWLPSPTPNLSSLQVEEAQLLQPLLQGQMLSPQLAWEFFIKLIFGCTGDKS